MTGDRAPSILDQGGPADEIIENISEDVEPQPLDQGDGRGEVLHEKESSRPLNSLRHQLTLVIISIIGFLGLVLIVLVACIQNPETQAAIREMGTLIFPPLITLAATSFGWFFATKDRGPKDK